MIVRTTSLSVLAQRFNYLLGPAGTPLIRHLPAK
jgi:hypothetical protein